MNPTRDTFFAAYRGARGFKKLPRADRSIVVYAEDSGSWPHLGPIIESLIETHKRRVVYLASSATDPVLGGCRDGILPFFIGSGHVRTWLFRGLEAGVLVMTMPDLDNFHVKRSFYRVHYLYVHHSIVSTHMIYRKGAFDHFDTICCVGPHHER